MGVAQFSYQAGAASLSHFTGKSSHGFLGDYATFAAGKRCAGIVEGRQKRQAPALAVFPQRKRLLHGFFLAAQPSSFDRAAGEGF